MSTPFEPQSVSDPQRELATRSTAEDALLRAIRSLGAEGDYLVRGLATVIGNMPPIPPRPRQSAHAKARAGAGAMTAEDVAAAEDRLAQGALQLAQASGWLASAWETVSLDAASRLLHRTSQNLLRAADRDELLMVELGGEQRIPTWQFTTRPVGHLLPHLAELMPALLNGWRPLTIGRFFTTRQEDLIGEGMKTPAGWLEDGGDPSEVLDLIDAGLRR